MACRVVYAEHSIVVFGPVDLNLGKCSARNRFDHGP
jgi:hypothetical protein